MHQIIAAADEVIRLYCYCVHGLAVGDKSEQLWLHSIHHGVFYIECE